MPTRLSIYDKNGRYLTEIDATFKRSWVLNGYGTGSFTLSTAKEDAAETKAKLDFLQFGNLVYAEHDKLPVWSGIIDTPREWGQGKITVYCYTPEYILTARNTHKSHTPDGPPGSVFEQIFDDISDVRGFELIKMGAIYGGGASVSKEYHYKNIYSAIRELADESGNDWSIDPVLDAAGRLTFQANWYERRGRNNGHSLYEDVNIVLAQVALREQGVIGNRVRCFGSSGSWSERIDAIRTDEESIGRYGIRYVTVNTDADTTEQLSNIADQYLVYYRDPRKTYNMTVIDNDTTNTYKYCRIGDTLTAEYYTVGFTGSELGSKTTVRIMQMEFDEENNQLTLTTDEDRT